MKHIDLERLDSNPRAANRVSGAAVLVCTFASIIALYFWLIHNPVNAIVAEVPGTDGAPPPGTISAVQVDLAGIFEAAAGTPSDLPGAWTSFRGPDAMNIAVNAPPLSESWGDSGPKVLWTIPVGDGYAAPTILNGRVYLMDYDMEKRADALRCLSLDDGKEIWRRSYELNIKRNHGMSRTIPAVTEDYIVTIGPKCHVVALDTETGDFLWGIDLQRDYGTEVPLWYAGQCPIIEDGIAIIAPGGTDTLMMAVDCKTGDVLWKTPNPNEWGMSHSSIIPMTVAGRKMYVYAGLGGMTGVSAEPGTEGKVLWEIPLVAKVVAPSPVVAGEDLIFATAGYGTGSRLLRLTDEGDTMSVEMVYDRPPMEVLACEQQTPVFYDGLLYGIMPKDAGALKGQFVCYRPDGTLVWSSGQDNRFGLGPFLVADGKFFILDDEGTLTMTDARRREFVQLGQAEILHGHDAWGPLALAGSRLFLRDMNTLACVELGTES